MPREKHPVNVLFTDAEYAKLVTKATELTLQEGRRVSVAEMVRRLTFSRENGFQDDEMNVSGSTISGG